MAVGDDIPSTDWSNAKVSSKDKAVGRMVQASSQSLAHNTSVAIQFGTSTEVYDTDGFHSESSNNTRVTPNRAGYYRFRGSVSFTGQTDYTSLECTIAKNGTGQAPAFRLALAFTTGTQVIGTEIQISMNGTTDYVELVAKHVRTGAAASSTVVSSQFATALEWEFLRPITS